eukprot:2336629-Pyramimonas_sp.AAC.1
MGLESLRFFLGDPNAEPGRGDDAPAQPDWFPTAGQLTDLELARGSSGHPSYRDVARPLGRGNAMPEVTLGPGEYQVL